jgi:hypothetical protein
VWIDHAHAIQHPATTHPKHQRKRSTRLSPHGWDAGRRAERSRGTRRRATGGRPTAVVDYPHHDTDIDIYISGAQHHDGSVTRDIAVHELNADPSLTIKQARQLAQALTELAAEAEQMAGYDQITVS